MAHEASALRNQIVVIWNRLRLPEDEREKLDAMTSSVTQQTLNDVSCRDLIIIIISTFISRKSVLNHKC
jgi:hypothetical protein